MRTSARQIIFITLVATALCGDRVASALPVEHSIGETACRVVTRLADSFMRTAPVRRPAQFMSPSPIASQGYVPITAASLEVDHFHFTPFQFRLPPPVI